MDARTTQTPATVGAEPQRRRPWLWIGAALWIAVLAWGGYVVRERSRSVQDDSSPSDGGLSEDGPSGTGGPTAPIVLQPQDPEVVERKPTGGWDPQGLPDFEFKERSGRKVTKQDLVGRPWLACFVFSRCAATCPAILKSMHDLHDALADTEVRLVTFTVDPAFDTREVLDRMAENYGADPARWWFLTGEQSAIYSLILHGFKMPVKEMLGADRAPGFEVMHSNNVMHVDATGRVVGKYNGVSDVEMAKLRRVLRGEQVEPPDAGKAPDVGKAPAEGKSSPEPESKSVSETDGSAGRAP